jgi:hypothetical protein
LNYFCSVNKEFLSYQLQKTALEMINKKRRLIIILASVGAGSLISFFILKKKMGSLTPNDYLQLGINFLFAVAIVVGIGFLFSKMDKGNIDK